MCRHVLWCGCAGSSLEVKTETDSNDAVGIMTEANSSDVTDYMPGTSKFAFCDDVFRLFICLYDFNAVYDVLCFMSLVLACEYVLEFHTEFYVFVHYVMFGCV